MVGGFHARLDGRAPGEPRREGRARIRVLAGTVLFLLVVSQTAAWGEPIRAAEYEVKAAFLYNFGRFVQWPPAAWGNGDSFVLCLLGRDPFGPALSQTVTGKKIQDKDLVVRQLKQVSQAEGCHILFVSGSERWHLAEVLSEVRTKSVLTVGEAADFTERGGIIGFTVEDSRVRFDINLASAQDAGLTISSQLLKLARIITPARNPGA